MFNFLQFLFLGVCCITVVTHPAENKSAPVLYIPEHIYSICEGDIAVVDITISGLPPVFLNYEFEDQLYQATSTRNEIILELSEEGTYYITGYGDSQTTVSNINDSIIVEVWDAPEVYFTGGGSVCSSEELNPLTAHFTGEPPFVLNYIVNGQPYTLYLEGYTYTFPIDQNLVIETMDLTDANCQAIIEITAKYEIIIITQPDIYGETNFCQNDSTIYSTDPTELSAEWLIPEGANYVEGVNNEGSFISVTWIEPGTHEVRLRLFDAASQCTSLWSSLPVTVYEKPDVMELIDTAICFELEEYVLIEIQTGANSVLLWPELDYSGTSVELYTAGNYTYIESSQYGCTDTGTVVIEDNCVTDIFVPEAFTPNGDGINDYLEIFGFYTELDLSIYSPSGIILYRGSGQDPPWDGTHGGNDVPEGSYHWYATYNSSDKIPRNASGIVTIIR